MAEKGKAILDMNTVMESPDTRNGVHGSAGLEEPYHTQLQVVNAESGEVVKKRRGRPRKYAESGNSMVPPGSDVASPPVVMSGVASPPVMSGVASPPVAQVVCETPAGFILSPSDDSSNRTQGRGRGRPPGSGIWQVLASQGEMFADTAAADFRAHVIDVHPGEDVIAKIMSLTRRGPKGISVLSANGTVSDVVLRQPYSSGGIIRLVGQFEILSLNGSYTISETGGVTSNSGGTSVSVGGPNGNVFGGALAGPLVAATRIQAVVGSFVPDAYKKYKQKQAKMVSPIQSVPGVAASVPGVAASVTSASQVLPHYFQVPNHVEADNGINGVGPSCSADLNSAEEPAQQNSSPDINMTAPDE